MLNIRATFHENRTRTFREIATNITNQRDHNKQESLANANVKRATAVHV